MSTLHYYDFIRLLDNVGALSHLLEWGIPAFLNEECAVTTEHKALYEVVRLMSAIGMSGYDIANYANTLWRMDAHSITTTYWLLRDVAKYASREAYVDVPQFGTD